MIDMRKETQASSGISSIVADSMCSIISSVGSDFLSPLSRVKKPKDDEHRKFKGQETCVPLSFLLVTRSFSLSSARSLVSSASARGASETRSGRESEQKLDKHTCGALLLQIFKKPHSSFEVALLRKRFGLSVHGLEVVFVFCKSLYNRRLSSGYNGRKSLPSLPF